MSMDLELINSPQGRIISSVERYYWLHSKMPAVDHIVEEVNLPYKEVVDILEDAATKAKLIDKGIINQYQAERMSSYLTFLELAHDHPGLDPIQILAVNMLLNTADRRSERKKLEEIGVKPQQLAAWKKQPTFMDFYRKRSKSIFGELDVAANSAMARMINDDNFQAVKLFFEMNGDYTPKAEINVKVNVHLVLTTVVEIIARYTTPEVAVQIAEAIEAETKELLRG